MGGQKFFEKLCGAFFGAFRRKCGASQFEPINHTGWLKTQMELLERAADWISFGIIQKKSIIFFVKSIKKRSPK